MMTYSPTAACLLYNYQRNLCGPSCGSNEQVIPQNQTPDGHPDGDTDQTLWMLPSDIPDCFGIFGI